MERILEVDTPPRGRGEFQDWILANNHLTFLEETAAADEILIRAHGPYSYIHSIAVPLAALDASQADDLLQWNGASYEGIASYSFGATLDSTTIERHNDAYGVPAFNESVELVFLRTFEGWTEEGRNYFEANQEYTHLTGIHWRPDQNAYCRFDENGDLAAIISATYERKKSGVSLVTFTWPDLEKYLAISNCALVRLFDFTLLRYGEFSGWQNGQEKIIRRSDSLYFRQMVADDAAYTRGVQIIRPRDRLEITPAIHGFSAGRNTENENISFIAMDLRHDNRVVDISIHEAATTNYFQLHHNDLPFEMSPAFFRPEVLSKYKADREKYTIKDRSIECRAAWSLRNFDINDAGQVFAYIRDLRHLPHAELLYWKSYNEPPKANISKRAFVNDFKGDVYNFSHPRDELMSILRDWESRGVLWWTVSDKELYNHANPPVSSSKHEWSEAIMDLSKLIVEGFNVRLIRKYLDDINVNYDPNEQSISLLERLISANKSANSIRLDGLREAQRIRSKVRGHSGGSESVEIAQSALTKYETYSNHFSALCSKIIKNLRMIEQTF